MCVTCVHVFINQVHCLSIFAIIIFFEFRENKQLSLPSSYSQRKIQSQNFYKNSIQQCSAKMSLANSPFLLSSSAYYSLNSPHSSMCTKIEENPLSSVKLRVHRSNSFSNLTVPSNANVSRKKIPNRNSMLEYRYIQNSNLPGSCGFKNKLDNMRSSDLDSTYLDEINCDIMSMSVPDSNYFDMLQEYPYEQSTQCDYKTKRTTYPNISTTYVSASDPFKALRYGVPVATGTECSFDPCVSKSNAALKLKKSSNSSTNLYDSICNRGYDSEPNWGGPSKNIDIVTKSMNYHDDMTRKWVERGTNNLDRTSLSLNIIKQESWSEFDDDNSLTSNRNRKNIPQSNQFREKSRDDVPSKLSKHSENRTSKDTKNDLSELKIKRKSSKEIIECKTYFDKTKLLAQKSDTATKNDLPKNNKVTSATDNKVKLKKLSRSLSKSSEESGSDDVFESPNRKSNPRSTKRRSSSLDALASSTPFESNQLANRNRSSVVSINDKPEYYEYPKSPLPPNSCSASSSVANDNSTFHNSLGVNLLRTTPKRASLKKSSNETSKNSSDYDVRDRGRGRNGNGGRDSYRERHRERDSDRGLSDREQRESYARSSFNRSMSNAEGTPEDKIG